MLVLVLYLIKWPEVVNSPASFAGAASNVEPPEAWSVHSLGETSSQSVSIPYACFPCVLTRMEHLKGT